MTEFNPRPWLCSARHARYWCSVTSAASSSNMVASCSLCVAAGLTTCVSSLASAPGANAHIDVAQFPEYWRNDGRNETSRGRSSPRIGKNSRPATVTASSTGSMFPSPYPSCAWWPRNRNPLR